MTARPLDLNADLGEGAASDRELLEVVTSANVACGFHAGDAATMRATCALAATRGVTIGAHVAYADREGFGRRELDVPADRLAAQAAEQIDALAAAAAAAGTRVAYLKPHGALYHRCTVDAAAAAAVASAASAAGLTAVLGLPGSALLAAAAGAGLAAVSEGFADRRYAAVTELVPRTEAGAVLGAGEAAAQARSIAADGVVALAGGGRASLAVRSLCVHGDTAGAAAVASAVRAAIEAAGAGPVAFA